MTPLTLAGHYHHSLTLNFETNGQPTIYMDACLLGSPCHFSKAPCLCIEKIALGDISAKEMLCHLASHAF